MASDWLKPAVVMTLIGSVVVSLVYAYLFALERKRFLAIWTASWCVYTLRFGFLLAILTLERSPYLLIANQWALFISAVLLVWGAREFLEKSVCRWCVPLYLAVLTWIAVASLSAADIFWVSLPGFLITGAIYAYTGFVFMRFPAGSAVIRGIVGWTFILWGVHKVDYPFLQPVEGLAPYGYCLGAIFALVTALGIILLYFETARQRLRASEEQFRAITANLPSVIYRCEVDPPWRMQFVSEPVEALTGRPPAEFFNNPDCTFGAFIHEEDKPAVEHEVSQAVAERRPFEFDYRFRRRDGEIRWVHEKGRAVFDKHGDPQYLDGVITDITVRKETEEALQLSQFAMDNVRDAIFWVWHDGRVWSVNDAACRSLGYTREELEGLTVPDIDPGCPPDAWARYWEHLREKGAEIVEARHRRRDGSTFHAEVAANFLEFRGLETICAFVRDISERRRAEQERRDLEAQVQHAQKLESLGILAGGIAHDFNNLLMGVLGHADLILHELPPEASARENLGHIQTAANKAADLARQMLAYSGRGSFIIETIDLTALVEEMASLLEASVSKRATLRYTFGTALPPVSGDATQFRQVVMNLITNASEAIGDAEGVIHVKTGVVDCDREYLSGSFLDEQLPPGRYVYLEVSDTGCGMDPETQRKIFDPFFTTKFTGRGLGLAAVLGIIRGHEGALKLYSEPGHGTCFRVFFPASASADFEPSQDAAEPSFQARGGAALVVDDEETVRTMSARMLEKLGFEALTAEGGPEALALYRERHDDIRLVLLDMTMPRMNGEEVFRELRRINGNVPVLLSSGYNEHEAMLAFAGKDLAGFIQKPYALSALRQKLSEILG